MKMRRVRRLILQQFIFIFFFRCENVNFSPKSFSPCFHLIRFRIKSLQSIHSQQFISILPMCRMSVGARAVYSNALCMCMSMCVCRVQSGVRKTSASPVGIEIINDFQRLYNFIHFHLTRLTARFHSPSLFRPSDEE